MPRAEDPDSILARGGTLRLSPPLATLIGSVLAPLAMAMVGARLVGVHHVGWLMVVAGFLAVVSFTLSSRSFVSVVGSALRWRIWGRTHEVSLAEVDLPLRTGGSFNDRLVVRVGQRRGFTLYVRVWGVAALDDLEARLIYNARVARPRASAAGS